MNAKHGGKRDGAGRRPDNGERKIQTGVRLTPSVVAWLKTQHSTGSVGAAIEQMARRSKSFKEFAG